MIEVKALPKQKVVYLYINGIRTFPGESKNWNRRAVTYTHKTFGGFGSYGSSFDPYTVAETIEYFIPATLRFAFQKKRAKKLNSILHEYKGWQIIVVAHSNGADVFTDAMKMYPHYISRLHFISPAIDWDCQENSLNGLTASKRISIPPTIWIAGKDKALKAAGRWGGLLGYGDLGLKGPKPGTLGDWGQVYEPHFDHSDWFIPENFDKTMTRIFTS